MGKVVGGLFGAKDGSEHFAAAQKAFSKAQALSDEQIARNKSYLESWEATFGNLEDNVANYISNLNPQTEAARQLANFEEQYVQSLSDIKSNFSKRFGEGVTGSGLRDAALISSKLEAGKVRAAVKSQAAQQVFQQQAGVYGQVVGQRQQARGQLNQAFQNASGVNLNVGQQQVALGQYHDAQQQAFGDSLINFAGRVAAGIATGGASEIAIATGGNLSGTIPGTQPQVKLPKRETN